MRKWFTLFKIFLCVAFFIQSYGTFAQNSPGDSSSGLSSFHNAVGLYHSTLSPETGLYDGTQYPYEAYYPIPINEGHPFFLSQRFNQGSVFYNNVFYDNVPLLYDIIKDKLLINDPTGHYVLILNSERIGWFNIAGHTFVRIKQDNTNNSIPNTGFYDQLYNGTTSLYKKVFKILKENTASVTGLNEYVVEGDEYFIKKNNQYYRVNNKKSLMSAMSDNKKDVGQFMKKNRLNLKRNKDYVLARIVAYYDSADKKNAKADN